MRTATASSPYLAEALGTFILVFGGPGTAAVNAASGGRSRTTASVSPSTNVRIGQFISLMIYRFRT